MKKTGVLEVPQVVKAGSFNSRQKFGGMDATHPRLVKDYELELFTQDGGTTYLDGLGYPIKEGALLLARPGQTRYSWLHFTCRFVHFRLEKGGEEGGVAGYLDRIPSFLERVKSEDYLPLFDQIASAFLSDVDGGELVCAANLLKLIHRHYQDAKAAVRYRTDSREPLLHAIAFIHENYAQELSLERMAASCSLSPIYFHKLFTQETGMTPHRYLLKKRLEAAKALLLASDLPLLEIALSCGFASQAHFCTVFKKEYGQTPGNFRKNLDYPDRR